MWPRVLLHLFHRAFVQFELEVERFRYRCVGYIVVSAEIYVSLLPRRMQILATTRNPGVHVCVFVCLFSSGGRQGGNHT